MLRSLPVNVTRHTWHYCCGCALFYSVLPRSDAGLDPRNSFLPPPPNAPASSSSRRGRAIFLFCHRRALTARHAQCVFGRSTCSFARLVGLTNRDVFSGRPLRTVAAVSDSGRVKLVQASARRSPPLPCRTCRGCLRLETVLDKRGFIIICIFVRAQSPSGDACCMTCTVVRRPRVG